MHSLVDRLFRPLHRALYAIDDSLDVWDPLFEDYLTGGADAGGCGW